MGGSLGIRATLVAKLDGLGAKVAIMDIVPPTFWISKFRYVLNVKFSLSMYYA